MDICNFFFVHVDCGFMVSIMLRYLAALQWNMWHSQVISLEAQHYLYKAFVYE